jgi:iron complex transport system permease protein
MLESPAHRIALPLAILGSLLLALALGWAPALPQDPRAAAIVLWEIRLPRALIAALAGASLGLCGAALQGLLRNPLASPDLIGSANGAALGAVAVLYFGAGGLTAVVGDLVGALALPLGGIAGALLATWGVWRLAGPQAGVATIILAGVAVNALAIALVSLLLNLAPSPYAVQEMLLWMLGSVSNRSLGDLWVLLPGTLLGYGLLLGTGRALEALTLGEETAHSLGTDPRRLRARIFVATGCAVGSAVAVTGTIGFIGLVVPHLLRPLVGHRPGPLLWLSALGGAVLLLAADLVVRLLPDGTDLKLGVITSLVGAPFFLYLILKSRREWP